MSYFTITTNKETADKIVAQCNYDAKYGGRSYKLGDVIHKEGFSIVQILSKEENGLIKAEDVFWLGHFSNQPL